MDECWLRGSDLNWRPSAPARWNRAAEKCQPDERLFLLKLPPRKQKARHQARPPWMSAGCGGPQCTECAHIALSYRAGSFGGLARAETAFDGSARRKATFSGRAESRGRSK